ncbi:MAG: DUF3667 domain-containing protein [Bacteroidia bacterium]|nr:DUF3667 domain-containing protein [Bacteroidia bacterium]
MSDPIRCKNCESRIEEGFNFCPECGQEITDNLTFGVLFHNTIENFFSVDARFFRSFIPLMIKPGVLARRFVDGKRLSYLHPAQFYLFISVLFFFIFSFSIRKADSKVSQALKKGFDSEIVPDSVKIEQDSIAIEKAREAFKENRKFMGISDEDAQEIDSAIASGQGRPEMSFSFDRKVLDSLIANNAPEQEKLEAMGMKEDAGALTRRFFAQLLKFYNQKGDGILQTFYDTIPIAMFFMLPLFAFLLKIFYWRRATFAHHMVFSFYYFTFLFTAFCILLTAELIWDIPFWIEFLFFLSFMVYLIAALMNFYKSSWIGAILKAGIITFVYLLLIVPTAFIGIVLTSFMLY